MFKQVIVIGYGFIAGEVLKDVYKKSLQSGYIVEYIEHEVYPFNQAKKYAEAEKIEYHVIENKTELLEYFMGKTATKTLIISASNNFIFPSEMVSNENITIINFHNALLPDLPGRNAPSWAIFEGRDKTGITWHYVTKDIDAGDIIIQKECKINDDIKAYELVSEQMRLALEAFRECYDEIIHGMVQAQKQIVSGARRVYKSYEIPADGMFDLTDSAQYIYRLLRAMDYGKNDIFPMPVTEYKGNRIRIRRYKKIKKDQAAEGEDRIYLTLDNEYLLMLRYDIAQDSTVSSETQI